MTRFNKRYSNKQVTKFTESSWQKWHSNRLYTNSTVNAFILPLWCREDALRLLGILRRTLQQWNPLQGWPSSPSFTIPEQATSKRVHHLDREIGADVESTRRDKSSKPQPIVKGNSKLSQEFRRSWLFENFEWFLIWKNQILYTRLFLFSFYKWNVKISLFMWNKLSQITFLEAGVVLSSSHIKI